jgi:hypothetical protein
MPARNKAAHHEDGWKSGAIAPCALNLGTDGDGPGRSIPSNSKKETRPKPGRVGGWMSAVTRIVHCCPASSFATFFFTNWMFVSLNVTPCNLGTSNHVASLVKITSPGIVTPCDLGTSNLVSSSFSLVCVTVADVSVGQSPWLCSQVWM